ncbi:hypothetical protein SAZ11_62105 [Streptomyces sp. FXJ1.4098]|nr:hypothetical protein [Streptomyces sp. FXJ1.4098]
MKPLAADQVTGVWGTLLLPIEGRGDIIWDRPAGQLDVLLTSGIDGLYAHGTAGEFHTLDEAAFDQVNTVLAQRCEAAGLPYQIGASHPATPTMLGRIGRRPRSGRAPSR